MEWKARRELLATTGGPSQSISTKIKLKSTAESNDLWSLATPDGRSLRKLMQFMYVYMTLNPDPAVSDIMRNCLIRQPLLWMARSRSTIV